MEVEEPQKEDPQNQKNGNIVEQKEKPKRKTKNDEAGEDGKNSDEY